MADDHQIPVRPRHARTARVRFCSRCGALAGPPEPGDRPGAGRVCRACGMGLCLECAPDALGLLRTFFVVVTDDLRVGAVSHGAEEVLGPEAQLLGAPVASVMACPLAPRSLTLALRRAAFGGREHQVLPIEPLGARGRDLGPLVGRISTCGPPRAALVAIEPALAAG